MSLVARMSRKKQLPRVSSRVPSAFKDRVDTLKVVLRAPRRWFPSGEKLSEEAIVASALLHFMDAPFEEQARILDRWVSVYDDMMEQELLRSSGEDVDLVAGLGEVIGREMPGGDGGAAERGAGREQRAIESEQRESTAPGKRKRGKAH